MCLFINPVLVCSLYAGDHKIGKYFTQQLKKKKSMFATNHCNIHKENHLLTLMLITAQFVIKRNLICTMRHEVIFNILNEIFDTMFTYEELNSKR